MNGYQIIQQIAERSGGAWKPSPGSVYPTVQQLEDEGLVEGTDGAGPPAAHAHRRGARATSPSTPTRWPARGRPSTPPPRSETGGPGDLKPVIGQVMGAVWQVVVSGTKQQQAEAAEILADTRRKLYGLLAEGDEAADEENGVMSTRPGQPELRIGDDEREAAVTALGEHYAAGRLTKDEYDERAERACGGTDPVAAPAVVRRPAPPRGGARRRTGARSVRSPPGRAAVTRAGGPARGWRRCSRSWSRW